MKNLIFIAFSFCLFNSYSQESNLTLRIEPGFLLLSESENLGLLLNIEPNIKISHNTLIGLRFGIALNSQKFENNNSSQFFIDERNDNAVISFMPTFDYYLSYHNFRPYVGLGLGYYVVSQIVIDNPSEGVSDGSVKNQVGLLLRGGFEFGKTRLGLEYNFSPKADIEISTGKIIGKVDNSYFGISIGFKIGGGKI